MLSRDSHLLRDYAADRDILAALVEHMDLGAGPDTNAKLRTPEGRVKETTHVASLVADHLRRVPGRKSLIWFTSGLRMMIGGGFGRGGRASPSRRRSSSRGSRSVWPS
jgi:hypothetical protein